MTRAIFDLSRIQERREGRRTKLRCEVCGAWVRELQAVRVDAERPGVVWMCGKCVRARG